MTLTEYIKSDPIYDKMVNSKIEPKLFDWHVHVKLSTLRLCLNLWIDTLGK